MTISALAAEQDAPKVNPSPTMKSDRQPLEKGMRADVVRQLVGDPAEIHPIKAPEGSAEKWIYRRVVDTRTRLVNIGEGMVSCHYESPEFTDMPFARRVGIPITRMERTTIYQVTALLMCDNQLVVARQWKEAKACYEN